ncbi:DUF6792 domain-containing protein [Terribacillus saccharophilus]|uniref:DUF6792 domain-containing protein n=1 Tax=Terribacillus saccharophilus TaxID=361277 RepID=UPI002DC5962F|nr:hypothetical protein [Terribacillus saccharophilus]MEC0291861.1 hypothetical protein [Terribacillus saccharophilus]
MPLDKITKEEIWMRLVNSEYGNNPEKMEETFRTIYLEETGELFEGEVEVFHSSDSNVTRKINSNYDGTALSISSGGEQNLYVISQGTQGMEDWLYNIKGPFAGIAVDQVEAAKGFTDDAITHFNIDTNKSDVISFNHSLGLHNSGMTALTDGTFDEVYGVNGLMLSPYELAQYDVEFAKLVQDEFNLRRITEIQDVPLEDIKKFALDYYGERDVKIHNTVSEDDPLYSISEKFGFITEFSETKIIDTNPNVSGLKEMIDKIPAPVIESLRVLATDYAEGDEKGGFNQSMNQLLGANIESLDEYSISGAIKWYREHPEEVDQTISGLNDNLPRVLENIRLMEENSEVIFDELYKGGYITADQKKVMIKELGNLEKELTNLQEAIQYNVDMHDDDGWFDKIRRGLGDAGLAAVAAILYFKIPNILDRIKESGTLESLEGIVDSHSIPEMLNALAEGNRSYVGKDLVFTSDAGGGDPIKVNMSAAMRLYTQGVTSLEDKQTLITELETLVRDEIEFAYKDEQWKVMREIYNVESSPSSYAHELGQYRFPSYKISSVNVLHEIYPLEQADLDEEIAEMKYSVDTGFSYIENYRKAIEELFKEDEEVPALFDLSRRI